MLHGFEVLAGDFHCHVQPPDHPGHVLRDLEETVRLAREESMDFVVLTPHVFSRFFAEPVLRERTRSEQKALREAIRSLGDGSPMFVPDSKDTDHEFGHVGATFADLDTVLEDVPFEEGRMDLGASLRVHLMPDASVDPWVGAGVGWEWLSMNGSAKATSGPNARKASSTLNGPTFLRVEAGADMKRAPGFALGPFASFQLGQYDSCSADVTAGNQSTASPCSVVEKSLHQWFTFGVRGAYTIGL